MIFFDKIIYNHDTEFLINFKKYNFIKNYEIENTEKNFFEVKIYIYKNKVEEHELLESLKKAVKIKTLTPKEKTLIKSIIKKLTCGYYMPVAMYLKLYSIPIDIKFPIYINNTIDVLSKYQDKKTK